MWRPWTDDQQPQQHTQSSTGTTEREPRRDRGGKGRGKKQGLRNVTNQQVALHPVPQKYGPSPRLLRGAVATTEVAAAAASEVDPLHTETETETERHRDGWEDRVQQLQERFRESPKKAIVSALKHTNGHAGKAARLLRSQWSPSALRHVTVLSSEGREETDTASETQREPIERGQETHREIVSEDEEDVDDLASLAGRSIAAASESLQHAVKSWAVTTDTALRAAPVPGTAMQHRDVAVQYTASGLVSAQELHEQARQMVAAQQRLEAELDCLRKRGIEERAELQREHREEIQAWQQKAAALQAEVTALQKARRQQRQQQRTQQREMASLVQTVATRANEASAQLRVRRDLLERGRNGLPRADVDSSVAAEHPSDHHGDDGSSSDGDADRLSQQPALDNTADVNSLPDNCAPIGSDRNGKCSSDDDDGVDAGYSSCVEPPEPQVERQVEPPDRQALQESPPNLQCAPPGPSPLQQQSGGEPNAAETPALDQRRRDRRRFLAATEGLPGSMSSSLSALLLYSSPVCARARSLAGVCDCS